MATGTLIKQPSESRLYTMDFAGLMADGEVITAVISVTISPITAPPLVASGGALFSGQKAQQRFTGGKSGTLYTITYLVTTDGSNTLEGEGNLIVKDL